MPTQYSRYGIICDVDGTITKEFGKESPVDEALIKKFCAYSKKGAAIALVSGRAYYWVKKNIIPVLKKYGLEKEVVIVSDYGALVYRRGKATISPKFKKFSKIIIFIRR